MNFLDTKKIHFVGAAGIGVSALARLFLARGAQVSGSESELINGSSVEMAKELEELGVKIPIGFDKNNLPPDTEVVVRSSVISDDNPEIVEAKERGIPILYYCDALGFLMKDNYYGIAVSGTNGKTTTTAMLGKILETAGLDPLVIVGGKVPGWDKNLRLAKGDVEQEKKIFLVEGDEYKRHMLSLAPGMIVLTNVEADHLDYYKDLADIESAFTEYVKKLGPEDVLVWNADDANTVGVAGYVLPETRHVSYGITAEADLTARDISYVAGGQHFSLTWQGTNLGVFSLPVPGQINIYNALAAAAAALALQVTGENIRLALGEFTGTWRRFQKMGMIEHKVVISDYAHHPTAVKATIRAAKELYPGKKILAVFQPHQKDRTKKFLTEFSHAFEEADTVLLSEIYDVTGREDPGNRISSRDLVEEIKKSPKNPPVGYEKSLHETERRIREIMDTFDLILIMGAGDIHTVAENLVKE